MKCYADNTTQRGNILFNYACLALSLSISSLWLFQLSIILFYRISFKIFHVHKRRNKRNFILFARKLKENIFAAWAVTFRPY